MFQELIDSVTNIDVFLDSIKSYFTNFSASSLIMTIIVIFMLVGLIDKLRGNKHGYGERFDAGFHAMGDLALAMVGIISISPVLLRILAPFVTPVFSFFGVSPAMLPASFLALDMGGYAMSMQLANGDVAMGNYAGIIVASTMGITLCFTIPYALTVLKKEHHALFARGVLIGIITLPFGCLIGGFAMYFTSTPLSIGALLINTLPVIILSIIVGLGIIFKQNFTLKVFSGFGKGVTFIATISPAIAIFQYLTGIRLPLFYLMVEEDEALGGVPLLTGLLLVGLIAIVLAGAFPMILFLNRRLGKIIAKWGEKTGVDANASSGLITQLASSIPIWSILNDMNSRGKLLNIVFAVSGSFVLGDVLAFTGGVNAEMVFPVVVAKISGGIMALILAMIFIKKNIIKTDIEKE